MKELVLSIVVPIYNVESYIEECLESLLAQELLDYEIICVNDGSKDRSMELVAQYDSPKIKIVNQENKGLSGARNTGLKHARGQYLMFIDSDDFIQKNCLKQLISKISANELDVLAYNFINFISSDNQRVEKRNIPTDKLMSGLEFYQLMYTDNSCPMSWLYVYNRDFLVENELLFNEDIIHEDVEFLIRLLVKVEKMKYLDEAIYYYRTRENSIMTSKKYNPKKIPSLYTIIKTYETEMVPFKDNTELMYLLEKRKTSSAASIIEEYAKKYDNIQLKMTSEEKAYLRDILKNSVSKKLKISSKSKLLFEVLLHYKKFKLK